MAALYLTQTDFDQKTKTGVTLVDFWATWCPPCKLAGPIIDELSVELMGKVTVGKVDVDSEKDLAARYKVMSIPTVILFKDGIEIDRQVGFAGKQGYLDLLKKVGV